MNLTGLLGISVTNVSNILFMNNKYYVKWSINLYTHIRRSHRSRPRYRFRFRCRFCFPYFCFIKSFERIENFRCYYRLCFKAKASIDKCKPISCLFFQFVVFGHKIQNFLRDKLKLFATLVKELTLTWAKLEKSLIPRYLFNSELRKFDRIVSCCTNE